MVIPAMNMNKPMVVLGLLAAVVLLACQVASEADVRSTRSPTAVPTRTFTAVPTQTPTPTRTPTPTVPPDSDNDGLLDELEAIIGTNPFQRDSDVDGLTDGEEVKIGSNPLFPDTDRDGVVDGYDIDPLVDIAVSLTLVSFVDHTSRGLFFDGPETYLVFSVDDQRLKLPVDYSQPVVFDVPDDLRSVLVTIRAYESPGSDAVFSALIQFVSGIPIPVSDHLFDISSSVGQSEISGIIILDKDGPLPPPLSGNGLDDGRSDDPDRYQATVIVVAKVVPNR